MGILGWETLDAENQVQLSHEIISNKPATYPWSVELQPTNKCNVDCFFCSSSPFRENEFLEWDIIESILRDGAKHNLKSIRLSGGGESLIYPKIPQVLELCKELNIAITDVTTNGTTLTRFAEPLVQAGLRIMSISLNEPEAQLYSKTMRCSDRIFDKAIEGVRAIVAARDKVESEDKPKIELKIMFHKQNYHLGLRMLELGQELDVDSVMINNIMFLGDDEKISDTEKPKVREILSEMIKKDHESGKPRLNFWLEHEASDLQQHAMNEVAKYGTERFVRDDGPAKDRIRYCMMGWYHATVSAKGIVYPCCNFVGMPNKEMGNVNEKKLSDIWKDSSYEKFRHEFRQLMLLKGNMEHSGRTQQYLEPMCIAENDCPFSWGLCDGKFYAEVAEELQSNASKYEKLEARSKNSAIKSAKKVKRMLIG